MPKSNSAVEMVPSAWRLMQSLRDMGYDFVSAVADLIDNSIEAGAHQVTIDVHFEGDDSWIRVADEGRGMSLEELLEAMRYGSAGKYDEDDLGKFGLGLKTASLSQCQRLTVTSHAKASDDIVAFCWDLDHIEKTNRWEALRLRKAEIWESTRKFLRGKSGTVVLWQRLDRILGYHHPYGASASRALNNMCRELEEHLAMVFHRFLAGDVPGKELKIIVNGYDVLPWDPFARSEPKTKSLDSIKFKLEHEGTFGHMVLRPYILPHHNDFSSQAAFDKASGPRKWNLQQGFYIYRANRLIQSGGWSGIRTMDEHDKLARIALEFPPALDNAFKINVAKMRVQIPAQIREKVKDEVTQIIRIADRTYRRKSKPEQGAGDAQGSNGDGVSPILALPRDGDGSSSATAQSQRSELGLKLETAANRQMLDLVQELLERVARPSEKAIVARVVRRARKILA
jgi:anti-sigma regulatory factor (Ser/Thr protein kinase)